MLTYLRCSVCLRCFVYLCLLSLLKVLFLFEVLCLQLLYIRPHLGVTSKENLFELINIHLFQKTLSERTANGSCRMEIARPKGTVVSIFGMQKQ